MHSNNFCLVWVTIFLIAGCATHYAKRTDADVSSAKDQCKILNEKRYTVQRPAQYRKRSAGKRRRTVLLPSDPEIRFVPATPTPVFSLAPDPTTMLASVSDFGVVTHSPVKIQLPNSDGLPLRLSPQLRKAEATELVVVAKQPRRANVVPFRANAVNGKISNAVAALAGAGGLLGMFLLWAKKSRSRDLSHWASRNPWKARGLITGTHVVTGLSALALGDHLAKGGTEISEAAQYVACLVVGTSVVLYPSRNTTSPYLIRKMCDVALFTSGTVLMLCLGNQYAVTLQPGPGNEKPFYSFTTGSHSENAIYLIKNHVSVTESIQQDKPEKKKLAKIALTILAVAVFAGLTYLLAALACSIACSGSEGVALFVFFGGAAGLIVLLVKAIRGIFRKGKKRKRKTFVPENTILPAPL